MTERTRLDKITYILQGLSTGIALILFFGIMGVGLYATAIGLQDSNGGGWLIFIVMMLGLWLAPCMVCWFAQIVLYVIGFIMFLVKKTRVSRRLSTPCGVISIVGCVLMILIMVPFVEDYPVEIMVYVAVCICGLQYCIATLVLSIINSRR